MSAKAKKMFVASIFFFLVLSSPPTEGLSLDGAAVALYNDENAPPGRSGAWEYGVIALKNMLDWAGLRYEEIDYNDLNSSPQDFSKLYRVILFPGGNAYWYNYWISLAGKERIRDFVAGGGGYFGICAGAFFACDRIYWEGNYYGDAFMINAYGQLTGYDLDLFPGIGIGPINGIADWQTVGYNMTGFDFAGGSTLMAGYRYNIAPSSEEILYYGGPYFLIDPGRNVEVLATYDYNGENALVAFRYGAGTIVLSGPHPEIEEDSTRDGICYAMMPRKAGMEDSGSDWRLAEHLIRSLIYPLRSVSGGDYNGDGTSEAALFRPPSGLWAIRNLSRFYFGDASDIPAAADYDGDRTVEAAVFRPLTGLWAVRLNTRIYFGEAGDLAVPGDYDGDGTWEAAIFRGQNGLWARRGLSRIYFGTSGDQPAAGDYDGDGSLDIALFRPDSNLWALRDISRFYFGNAHDLPLPGDYDGDGTWEAAAFRPASGLWAVRETTRCYFGGAADIPLTGDGDGDRKDEPTIFRPASGLWALQGLSRFYFGTLGDIPVTR